MLSDNNRLCNHLTHFGYIVPVKFDDWMLRCVRIQKFARRLIARYCDVAESVKPGFQFINFGENFDILLIGSDYAKQIHGIEKFRIGTIKSDLFDNLSVENYFQFQPNIFNYVSKELPLMIGRITAC